MWALAEAGVPVRRFDLGGDFGGLDDPAYRALNPHGRIPTLQDGDLVVWESDAIVRYVAARYAPDRLWPTDPIERAGADQWMAWTATSLYPDWIRLFWSLIRTPADRQDATAIAALCAATATRFQVLDRHLADRPYLAGDAFGMADIPAGMMLYRWFEMPIKRPPMPYVEGWYRRLCDRPTYHTTICLPFDDLVGKLPA